MARMCVLIIFFSLFLSYRHHTALFKGTPTVSSACDNVFRLVAASLFTICISTCAMSNFKLIVSKNQNKKNNKNERKLTKH